MDIVAPDRLWQEAREHFLGDGHYGFFLAGTHETPSGPRLLLHRFLPINPDEHTSSYDGPRNVELSALLRVVNEAKRTDMALVECHVHPTSSGGVRFSPVDDEGLPEFASYVLDALPGRPYGALVIDRHSVDGRWWSPSGKMMSVRQIHVLGTTHQTTTMTSCPTRRGIGEMAQEYKRQALDGFLGSEGQAALEQSTVAVVGLGGLGSHVAQQLAHLGVARLVLIDEDRVEKTNLNRLVGARKGDIGRYKVQVAKRQAHRLRGRRGIQVTGVKAAIPRPAALEALREANMVIGCVDNDGARLILNRVCRAYHLPYVDASSGIEPDDDGRFERAGGKVAVVVPGEPCLQCMGLLDMAEARHFLSPASVQQENRRLGYVEGWDTPDPSVVSLNGVVASMAVNEVLLYLARLRPCNPLTLYYLRAPGEDFQKATRMDVRLNAKCWACSLSGVGDKVIGSLVPGARESNRANAGV